MPWTQQQKPFLMQQRSVGRGAGEVIPCSAAIAGEFVNVRAFDRGTTSFASAAQRGAGMLHAIIDSSLRRTE